MQPKMKTQTYGISSRALLGEYGWSRYEKRHHCRLQCSCFFPTYSRSTYATREKELAEVKAEAYANYRDMRENGTEADKPKREFPKDGYTCWETPSDEYSKIQYIEGKNDAAWMAEKDANYAERFKHEEVSDIRP